MQDETRDVTGNGWDTVRRRAIVLTALIVIVPLLWLLVGQQLRGAGQLSLALVSVAVLAIATAWTVIAVPRRR